MPADTATIEEGLDVSIGHFGGGHRDKTDSKVALSCMVACSDIPSNFDPGKFFLLMLGFYVDITPGTCIYFSGLWKHGGTPPRAPRNVRVEKHHIRMVLILYPNENMTLGTAVKAIGSLSREAKHLGIIRSGKEVAFQLK